MFADLHIHGRYSRATSQRMNVNELVHYSLIKGLNLIGTGDFTHPEWMKELRNSLGEVLGTGLYKPTGQTNRQVYFMITSEVCTIFNYNDRIKKIHHVIMTPSFEIAEQISDYLSKFGSLQADGRPQLKMTATELVEEVINISRHNMIFPAHVWTPWFSLFGAFSGFDSLEDCYQDQSRHIFALETGLSSDPPMNWRLSALDKYSLLSNSDSHSPWPWRIGRETNVFELSTVTYNEVVDTIRKKDPKRFKFTIETNPAYGKYHWTGHRSCNVSLPPSEAIKLNNRCPVCNRKLTEGVEQRIEKLADRPPGFHPEGSIGFKHLLPLHEILASVLNMKTLSSVKIWNIYNALILRFGTEFNVLLEASFKELTQIVNPTIAEAIIRVRQDKVKIEPGYDGVYGKIKIFEKKSKNTKDKIDFKDEKVGLERFI